MGPMSGNDVLKCFFMTELLCGLIWFSASNRFFAIFGFYRCYVCVLRGFYSRLVPFYDLLDSNIFLYTYFHDNNHKSVYTVLLSLKVLLNLRVIV
jgi:hypothetical protein